MRTVLALVLSLTWAVAVFAQQVGFDQPQDVTSEQAKPNPNDADTLRLFVGEQYVIDDNLFRLPPASAYLTTFVKPTASRADHLSITTAGLAGQRSWNEQTVLLDAHVDENRFAQNSEFNGITGNGKLQLDWAASSLLTGQAGVSYDRIIPSFQDTLFYSPDLFSTRTYFGKGRLQMGPHWTVTAALSSANTSNSNQSLKGDDYRTQSGSTGIHYFTLAEDWVGVDYLYTDGRFSTPGILNGTEYSRDYHDNQLRGAARYAVSSKWLLNGYYGYLQHATPSGGFGSFSGDVWRATLLWQPLTKTQFTLVAFRDLASYLDAQSAFFVSKGYSLTPAWAPRDKIRVAVLLAHETHVFLGTGSSATQQISTVSRQDRLNIGQAFITYTPRAALTLKLSYTYQQRKSNVQQYSFDDNLINFGVVFALSR